MINRFLYCCAALLLLLAPAGESSAQSWRVFPDSIDLGDIQVGSSARDSFFVTSPKIDRTISSFFLDKGITIPNNPLPARIAADDTLTIRFNVTPTVAGPQTLIITLQDSTAFKDSVKVHFNATPIPQPAFRLSEDSIELGQLLVGGDLFDSFYVASNKDQISVQILSFEDSTKDSLILLNTSLQIPAADSVPVRYRIFPMTIGERWIPIIVGLSGTTFDTTYLHIEAVGPTSPDSIFALVPGRLNTLAVVTEEDSSSFQLTIRNVTQDTLILQDFILEDSEYFAIEDVPVVPLILEPNSPPFTFGVYARKTGSGFFRTNVRVPNNGGLASEYSLGVQVLKTIQASVPPTRTQSGITVHQSATEIAIEAIPFETGRLEIFDLLGRKLVEHPITSSEMFITKQDASGARIEDGCYIIRLTDAKGQHSEAIKVLLVSY
jgi:hypothetical protein